MTLKKKSKEKKPIQTLGSELDNIEKDVEALIARYRNEDLPMGTAIVSSIPDDIKKLPEDGFYLVLISKRKERTALRQFGCNMTSDIVLDSFVKILRSLYVDVNDVTTGRA